MKANNSRAPNPSVPIQAAKQRVHSGEESESEIGKSTDIPFSKRDQDGQQAEADKGGEPGPWPARQQRDDILARRQQERRQRTDRERRQTPPPRQIGRNRKALEDIEGGIQRVGAENDAGQQHEDDGQRPAQQSRQSRTISAPQ